MRENRHVDATGIGSLPGEDFAAAARFVVDTFGPDDVVFVPELPDRGAPAGMIGRTAGILPLPIDLQPAGWRLAPGEGMDQRRARSLLRADLDVLEETVGEESIRIKQQLTGPLTLAATTELPRGGKALGDHGARRELAEALAEAAREQVGQLRRRFDGEPVIQVDEPAAPAVLAGRVPTASGFGRHRSVDAPIADALLRVVTSAVREAGGRPVVHCCAADVPVDLFAGAGFAAIAFDAGPVGPGDDWARVFEDGTDLWFGTSDPRRVEEFMGQLGFESASYVDRSAVTPPCGLAGQSAAGAREELHRVVSAARSLG